jgi:hypothetical protein
MRSTLATIMVITAGSFCPAFSATAQANADFQVQDTGPQSEAPRPQWCSCLEWNCWSELASSTGEQNAPDKAVCKCTFWQCVDIPISPKPN